MCLELSVFLQVIILTLLTKTTAARKKSHIVITNCESYIFLAVVSAASIIISIL